MLRPQETQIPKVPLFTVQLVECKALREAGERLTSEVHLLWLTLQSQDKDLFLGNKDKKVSAEEWPGGGTAMS